MPVLSDVQYLDSSPATDGEEIRKLLESRLDREKLEGMKHLIALISLGQDASDFFPSVVKNVVNPGVELKRMVYMYLVHYAEEKQEIALLSINSFQKDLSDSNQLIRALALRVMSSIRLDITLQVVMLSIKKCAKDSSAYVRKTAAHAIPKLFSMDNDQREPLTDVILDLMRDPSTLVIGSAVAAFQEVCPDRTDLIHGVFRRLCVVLADTDEWGQIVIIQLLARYARSQFIDPNLVDPATAEKKKKSKKKKGFYDDHSDEEGEGSVDSDHRLLLKATLPLLQSRNSGVVLAVAMLHFALAPDSEIKSTGLAKSMIRCSRVGREHAFVMLSAIESLAAQRPKLFRSFLKDFFVNAADSSFVCNLKLDIMTHIACRDNIFAILTEFHQYVKGGDAKLMASTIQAIGRAAVKLQDPEVTTRCLRGLIVFLASPQPGVVAESVFVLRNLVMVTNDSDSDEPSQPVQQAVRRAAKLLFSENRIEDSGARACIIWMLGEYASQSWLLKISADTLRQLAKDFLQEGEDVKLQTLTLASKLMVKEVERAAQIAAYVFELARYDTSFDVRDRARVLRKFLGLADGGVDSPLQQAATEVLQQPKPAPSLSSRFEDQHKFTIGSLSFMVNHEVSGYLPLPDFAETPSEPSLRVADAASSNFSAEFAQPASKSSGSSSGNMSTTTIRRNAPEVAASMHTGLDQFYGGGGDDSSSSDDTESGSSSGSDSSGSESDDDGGGSSSGSSSGSGSGSGSDMTSSGSSDDEGEPESTMDTLLDFGGGGGSSSEGSTGVVFESMEQPAPQPAPAGGMIDLMDLMDDGPSSAPAPAPSGFQQLPVSGMLMPTSPSANTLSRASDVRQGAGLKYPLLSHVNSGGLNVDVQLQREQSVHSSQMTPVRLYLSNRLMQPIGHISMEDAPDTVIPFEKIMQLPPNSDVQVLIHCDFGSQMRAIKFSISTDRGTYSVNLIPHIGDVVIPSPVVSRGEYEGLERRMGGMLASKQQFTLPQPFVGADAQLNELVQQFIHVRCLGTTWDRDVGDAIFVGATQSGAANLCVRVTIARGATSGDIKVSSTDAMLASRLAAEFVALCAA